MSNTEKLTVGGGIAVALGIGAALAYRGTTPGPTPSPTPGPMPGPTPSPAPGPTPGPTPSPTPEGSKLHTPGLQMRGPNMPPSPTYDTLIHGIIGEGKWGALEASEGQYSTAPIDAVVTSIRKFNHTHASDPRSAIARLNANISVPSWLAVGSGGGVNVSSPGGAGPPQHGVDARWWTTFMQDRHAKLLAWIGPILDGLPEITRATICGPDEIFDEVFVRFSINAPQLAAAGLTQVLDEASFFVYVTNTCAHLLNTSPMLDVSQYAGSLAFTETVIQHLIAEAKVRPTLAQASLNASNMHSDPVYAMMAKYGPKGTKQCVLRMQQEPAVSATDFQATVEAAIGYGVSELEVAPSYQSVSASVLHTLDDGLKANAY